MAVSGPELSSPASVDRQAWQFAGRAGAPTSRPGWLRADRSVGLPSSSLERTAVSRFFTEYFGPRTTEAGFHGRAWPSTSQSKSIRTAARCRLTVGLETSRCNSSRKVATYNGCTRPSSAIPCRSQARSACQNASKSSTILRIFKGSTACEVYLIAITSISPCRRKILMATVSAWRTKSKSMLAPPIWMLWMRTDGRPRVERCNTGTTANWKHRSIALNRPAKRGKPLPTPKPEESTQPDIEWGPSPGCAGNHRSVPAGDVIP